jgi:hypothetical protein
MAMDVMDKRSFELDRLSFAKAVVVFAGTLIIVLPQLRFVPFHSAFFDLGQYVTNHMFTLFMLKAFFYAMAGRCDWSCSALDVGQFQQTQTWIYLSALVGSILCAIVFYFYPLSGFFWKQVTW